MVILMGTEISNIFILHSLNGDTLQMWGKDVKEYFESKDINVIMPEFPIRAESIYEKFKVQTVNSMCELA